MYESGYAYRLLCTFLPPLSRVNVSVCVCVTLVVVTLVSPPLPTTHTSKMNATTTDDVIIIKPYNDDNNNNSNKCESTCARARVCFFLPLLFFVNWVCVT